MTTGSPVQPATTEQAFLLRAIGASPLSGPDPQLEALARHVDWPRLLRTAPAGLHPYLARCLEMRLSAAAVPAQVSEALRRARRANAAQHLIRQHELRRILGALATAEIPVLVLKGMALAHTTYPDPSTRFMLDIDLLVPENRWDAARDALMGIGLRVPERWAVRPLSGPNARPERDRPFECPGTRVLVELHATLESSEPPFAFSAERAWERAVDASLGGLQARVLGSEDGLFHIGLHLSSAHRFQHGLRALLDVHLHLERHARDWDWTRLARECQLGGGCGWMYLTLRLARDLLASPVPDALFTALEAPIAIEELMRLAVDQLWHAESVRTPPGIVSLSAGPPSTRLAQVLSRLNPWRREDASVATASRRLLVDLKTRVPLYLAAWRRGDLSRRQLGRAAELLRARDRIGELMGGDEGLPSPRRPGAGAR